MATRSSRTIGSFAMSRRMKSSECEVGSPPSPRLWTSAGSGLRTGARDVVARDVLDRRSAALAHRQLQLRAQDVDDALDARLAERAESPDVRTADADGARAERQRL